MSLISDLAALSSGTEVQLWFRSGNVQEGTIVSVASDITKITAGDGNVIEVDSTQIEAFHVPAP